MTKWPLAVDLGRPFATAAGAFPGARALLVSFLVLARVLLPLESKTHLPASPVSGKAYANDCAAAPSGYQETRSQRQRSAPGIR